MNDAWIADRMKHIDASGIRKAFDMSKTMKDPINLSIGLPDFDVAEPGQGGGDRGDPGRPQRLHGHPGHPRAANQDPGGRRRPVRPRRPPGPDHRGHVGRTSPGPLLRGRPGRRGDRLRPLLRDVQATWQRWRGACRCWSTPIPTSASTPAKVEAAMTARTKCVVVNTPANPTGVVATADEMRALAELCRRRDVLLISDEVYRAFCYDHPFATPASWNDDVLVVDGFSKTYGMTGWRLGYAHGPSRSDPGDGQAPAVQLRLRAEHGPVRRRRRPRPGPDRPDRCLSPQARHGRRSPERRLRARTARKVPSTPSRAHRGAPGPSSSPRRSRTTC